MSSISRRRNGLMALSVIGGSCLEGGSRPLISRQDARFCYFTGRHQLPRERFSPVPLKRPSRRPRKPAESGGERSFAEACLNGEVAPISAISGTPTVKRTPRGPGQALGPSPAPVTFRPTGRLKGVFCLAPSCLFLRGRANRPTTPIRGALQPTVAGDPWVIYRSRDFVDRDFVGDAAQRAALRCRGETAGFEQGRGLGVGNDRPRRQDRT